MALAGEVSAVDGKLVTVAVTISVGEKQKTTAEVRFELL